MRHEILVIDDEWPERATDYNQFASRTNSWAKSFSLSFDFLEDPTDLAHKINSKRYSAIVIDAKLDGNWKSAPLRKLLPLIPDELPIALVSSRWDNTIVDDVNAAWGKPNCKTFLRWSEILDQEDGGMRRVAFLLSKIIADHERLDFSLGIGPSDPIRLLHISDTQFGAKIKGDLTGLAISCAEAIMDGWGKQTPHLIAFTGDVAERGLPSEYEQAFTWLNFFAKRLGLPQLPSNRIMVVPGNHDYCLPLAACTRTNFGSKKKLQLSDQEQPGTAALSGYAFRPFVDFVTRVTDCPWLERADWLSPPVLSWVEQRFRHLGTVFYGLNTNNPINPNGFAGANVRLEDLVGVQKSLTDLKAASESSVVIGLGHHSPIPNEGRRQDLENHSDVVANLFAGSAKTGCFLHGHIHRSSSMYRDKDGIKLLISAASTLTLPEEHRAPNTLRGFSLIDIERMGGVVQAISVRPYNLLTNQFVAGGATRSEIGADGMPKGA